MSALAEIWRDGLNYKLFLSHKSEFRREAGRLKENLQQFGISCFVAHNDVAPTKKWQEVIEQALSSADGLAALMTDGFFKSYWTNQEIGIALARGIFILPIRLGEDPKGFISQFQALTCDIEKDYKKIVSILLKNDPNMIDAFINTVQESDSYDKSNTLSKFLRDINNLKPSQIIKLIKAYNSNSQLNESMGFNGSKPHLFGNGLFHELKRITGKDYSKMRKIKKI